MFFHYKEPCKKKTAVMYLKEGPKTDYSKWLYGRQGTWGLKVLDPSTSSPLNPLVSAFTPKATTKTHDPFSAYKHTHHSHHTFTLHYMGPWWSEWSGYLCYISAVELLAQLLWFREPSKKKIRFIWHKLLQSNVLYIFLYYHN